MTLPAHYPHYYRRYIRFAIVMTFVALLLGILFQESSKKAPYSAMLPAGPHLEAVINLALLHGHAFLIGVLIPLAIPSMMQLSLLMGGSPVSTKALQWGTRLYLPGTVLSLGLMLYKGYHYLLSIRFGQYDFHVIEQTYFGGMIGLRHGLYALSHVSLAVGLGTLMVGIWKSLNATPVLAKQEVPVK